MYSIIEGHGLESFFRTIDKNTQNKNSSIKETK